MKKRNFLLTLIVFLLCAAMAFASCTGNGDETTASPDVSSDATEAPDTSSEEDTTNTPDVTTEEITDEVTNAPEVTTQEPEVTTEPPHTHSFGAWTAVKAATCTEVGSEERVCSCGEKETRNVEALGHKDGEWITDAAAGCNEAGSKHQICSVCGETLKTDTIPALGHKEGEWIVDKEATADADGSKHQVCLVCGATIKTEIIASKPHTPGNWITDKEPNCTEEGSKHQICSECGVTVKTESIPANGHTEVVDAAVEATCTKTGLTEGKHCSVCNTVINAQQTVPVKAHTEVTDAAVEATCTKTGLTEGKHCSVCNAVIKAQEVVPVKAHTEVTDAAVAATCTKTGLTEGKHCSVCNAVIKAQEVVPVKAHTEVTDAAVEATCTKTGLTEGKHCSVCNTVIKAQEVVPVKAHTEVTDAAVAATCTKTGLTEGKHCSVCNKVIKAQETVKALGHKDGRWIVDKEPTTQAEGFRHLACATCGETIKTESIPKLEAIKNDYTVTVLDVNGNPVSGINVSFMKGTAEAAKVKTDKSGKAVAKLESGEYTVALEGADSYYVSADSYTVSDSSPAVQLELVPYVIDPQYIYPGAQDVAPSNNKPGVLAGVYSVSVGSVRVPVEKDKMRYLFFAPQEGALYHVYTDSDKVDIGYYGGNYYVSEINTGTMLENGAMEIKVLHSMVGNILVIGLKSTSASVDECTLTIEKYSDIEITLEELPYEMYEYQTPVKVETPSGNMRTVQITVTLTGGATDEIKVIYNAKDGYYHLNFENGPILYVRLRDKTIFQEALITIVGTSNLGHYIYDEEGNFVRKERFNEAIMAYYSASDDKHGVYPLNDDLMYILKALGDIGWYDRSSPNCIFTDDMVVVEPVNGWLFACVYFS